MAYHLYGMNSGGTGHLGRLSSSGAWHLVYGDGKLLLAPSGYHAYQLGHYNSSNGLHACDEGFIESKIGTGGQRATIDLISAAQGMILNDSGYWLSGAHEPKFIACCGSCALGCFGNNTGTNEIAMNAGFYAMVPRLKFSLPAGRTALSAEICFKGYSDYVIECAKIGNGDWNNAAFDTKSFRQNNSVSGTSHAMYNSSTFWDTQGTDLLIAHASTDPDELTIRKAFYSNFWHGTTYANSLFQYSMVLAGRETTVGSSKSLAYYLGNNTNQTHNGTFCGAIGTNAFPSGGSTASYANAYPLCDANDGTKTYANNGEEFPGSAGRVYKKTGGSVYDDSRIPSAAKNDDTWLAKSAIPLTPWQLDALNTNGYIWVMYSNPSPWFCTTDVVDTLGMSRQVFVERCYLKVEVA